MEDKQQFHLKWNNYHMNIAKSFDSLRLDEDFVDVTVICNDFQAKAHKVVLSACSPYFRQVLKSNPHPHPIVMLRDVSGDHLSQLLDFMYHGEVSVAQHQLSEFLSLARWLKVKGLADDREPGGREQSAPPSPPACVAVKREPPLPDFNANELPAEPQDGDRWPGGDTQELGVTSFSPVQDVEPATDQLMTDVVATDDDDAPDPPEKPGPSSLCKSRQRTLRGGGCVPRRASCPICGRWFQKGSHLREHVASIHFPVASRCELCGKTLRSQASLRTHRIKYHRQSERARLMDKWREDGPAASPEGLP